MEADLENLNLEDEEEGPILCTRNKITIENEHQVCLVGKALIDCIIHFPALKRTLADLWHPLGGVIISDLGDKRYLFKFFYEVDIKRVIDGIPWGVKVHPISGKNRYEICAKKEKEINFGARENHWNQRGCFWLELFTLSTLLRCLLAVNGSEESSQGLQSSRNPTKMELDLRTQGNSIDEEEINMGGRRTNGTQ
ncbi:hypothetical protein Goklo_017581 [Gossypium klotzschianum]|uniref:DUF4283 domain-containing protein n=1 Tax=Gossypium klotzschianum TaxID=34286 RepID=A0A7J8UHZ6_9ROSI|nr:hypothetical protein [Gossypium klotzschianum]